jgi:hypothetical protein
VKAVGAKEFFEFIFGGLNDGYLCIVTINRNLKTNQKVTGDALVKQHFFPWPDGLDKALALIDKVKTQQDVYFTPFLTIRRRRKKQDITETPVAWADGDLCPLESLLVPPSAVIRSSNAGEQDKYHFYWKFDDIQTSDVGEHISKRIAYYHADEGMDRSGWDLTQLLRVPETYNHKFSPPLQVSKAIIDEDLTYIEEDFRPYPEVESTTEFHPLENVELPDVSAQEILLQHKVELNPRAFDLYNIEPDQLRDWSKNLWELELICLEAGISPEETFIIARSSACNKYARDNRPEKNLWKEVQKAAVYVKDRDKEVPDVLTAGAVKVEPPRLLDDSERARVERDETFIERYTKWAKKLGDAAVQYHPAGAFVILSSLLCGNVKLPTSFGTVVPNLWFMILADTTLTRKSTAMDNATDLLLDIDDDILLATDGSIEGLLTSMATRSGKPSLFLRDEVTGLIEAMSKKEYMAGMMETLTKMYDAKHMKRILRRETIDVRDPRLVLFAGGIRSKMMDLLTYQHVSSGFLPRFIFITAESDLTRIKPIGPPTMVNLEERDDLIDEARTIYGHYAVTVNPSSNGKASIPKQWNAELTEEAWLLYNKYEFRLLDFAIESHDPALVTPMMDRLSKSGLKASVLLAASRIHQDKIEVTELDVLHAFYYIEQWMGHTAAIIGSIGTSQDERKLQKILSEIENNPGILRSKIMQKFYLNARETNDILATLEQRNSIKRQQRGGRGERIVPTGR